MEKVVVITGASSGFGRGVALKLAARGTALVLAARRKNLLNSLAHLCREKGARALVVPIDVSQPDQVKRLAEETVGNFGHFDVWVNNAGVGAVGKFEEIPLVDHSQVVLTNLLGVLYGSHLAIRHFKDRGRGVLINVASALGNPYYASYTASKFGVVGLSAALRQELAEHGETDIHVCTVMPMAMDTPFFDHAANYTGHEPRPVSPLYDPQKVIDTIVDLMETPEPEVVVGAAVAVEGLPGHNTHREVMEKAAPAPDTDGAVHHPTPVGAGVRGGRL